MESSQLWTGVLALASAVISLVCIYLGVGTLVSTETSTTAMFSGVLLLFYGAWALVVLGLAWWRGYPILIKLSTYAALVLFGAILIGSLDVGMISGLEALMLIITATLLWLQFVAVRRLVASVARMK